jgi:hypothetical protein
MKRITIEVGSHGVATTVGEMRRRLAKILSPLRGDQEVFFSFSAHLENYRVVPPKTTPMQIIYGELAEPENN